MRITQIGLKNFKGFSNASINLDGKSTVIFGENGSGKSSILQAINLLSWNWINKLCSNQRTAFRSLNAEMVNSSSSSLEITATFSIDGKEYSVGKKYTKSNVGRNGTTEVNRKMYDSFHEAYLTKYTGTNIPIMVNYGTNRSVLNVPLRIRNKHEFDKWSALENSLESTLDFRTFFEWIRNREDYELEVMAEKRDFDYKDPLLECVRNALMGMMDGFSDLRVKRNPLRLTVKKNGKEFSINQLSDGEKCTLALFGDLARRLGIANQSMENPLMGEGIVLIDEIELHMHPAWQRKVLRVLKSLFPNVQFIVSTHSPQVLSEADDSDKIICLGKDGEVEIINRLDGYDSNTILEDFMGTVSMNHLFRERVDNVYSLIQDRKFEEAEQEIIRIKDIIDENSACIIDMEGNLKLYKALYDKNL